MRTTDRPAIVGSADGLTGLTLLRVPGAGLTPMPVEAGLALSGSHLVLRWRPYHHWRRILPPPPAQETELIGGVARAGFAYWRPSGVWVVRAGSEPDLAVLLIRVRLTFAGQHPPRWPDIVVAPLLSRP